jgi:hypothetical protein
VSAFQKHPAERLAASRFHLIRHGAHNASSLDGRALESILSRIAELVKPYAPAPTKTALAQAVEDAERAALEKANRGDQVCWCAHPFRSHIGGVGCLYCNRCNGPAAREPRAKREIGEPVTVINDESRYFRRRGLAIARDDRGLTVLLDGTRERLHFEHSELAARRYWTRPKATQRLTRGN